MSNPLVVRKEVSATFADESEAKRFRDMLESAIDKVKRDWRDGVRCCPGLLELLDKYLKESRVRKKRRTDASVNHKKTVLTRFARDLSGGEGDIAIDKITRDDLLDWIEMRLEEPGHRGAYHDGKNISRDTVHGELKILRQFADWCFKRRYCGRDLELYSVEIEREPGKRRGKNAPRALPMHTIATVIKAIMEHYPRVALVIRGMILLGARPKALFLLKWTDIVLPFGDKPGQVSLPGLKGAARVDIPISANSQLQTLFHDARNIFHSDRRRWPEKSDFVFATQRGRKGGGWTTDMFDHAVERAIDLCGLGIKITPYVFRHSVITHLARIGISATAIQHYAKHNDLQTQMNYRWTSNEDAKDAYLALEAAKIVPDFENLEGDHNQ